MGPSPDNWLAVHRADLTLGTLLSSGTKDSSPDLRLVPNGSLGEGLLDDTEVPEILALCCLCLKHSRFLTLCMLGNHSCFFCCPLTSFKIVFFKKFFQKTLSEC